MGTVTPLGFIPFLVWTKPVWFLSPQFVTKHPQSHLSLPVPLPVSVYFCWRTVSAREKTGPYQSASLSCCRNKEGEKWRGTDGEREGEGGRQTLGEQARKGGREMGERVSSDDDAAACVCLHAALL